MTKNAPLGSPATPDETYEHVGRKLREFRVARKMTQAQVAKIIEVSPQQYQKYEDAQSKCSLTNLLLLAKSYGIHINELLPVDPPASTMPTPQERPSAEGMTMASEADLLARLVGTFVQLDDLEGKVRLVQLVEAIVSAQNRSKGGTD